MATTKTDAPAASTSSGFGLPRLIPSLPMNMLNSINPFASGEQSKTTTTETKEVGTADTGLGIPFLKRPIFGSILRPASTPPADGETNGQTHKRNGSTVMFAEPEFDDSDNASREGSVVDETRRRRRNKQKTSFSLCHPPPASSTRQKLHRRPRSLLQLHKLSPNARPVPAFEVIPSANFSVRLVKSITKTYKAKHGLCPNDLVILHAEKYYTEEHDEEQDIQDIVALICRGKSNESRAKIIMRDGEEWEAHPHSSGGYEFNTTDDHGLDITVRWVPKKSRDTNKGRRFNFSTIAAGTRKHPVIASLSHTGLEINDSYKVPDPAVSTPLSTPKHGESFLGAAMEAEDAQPGDECTTDDRLRQIITVTAIFVTFMESWSPYFKYDEKDLVTGSPRKDERSVSTPPTSPAQMQMRMLEKRGSMRSIGSGFLRRSSMLSQANRDSTISLDSVTSTSTDTPAAPSSTAQKHSRSRSDSASTVLVHRATSNRRKAKQEATWRSDLLTVQNSVPEASREDLTRKSSDRRTATRSTLAQTTNGGDAAGSDDDESEEEHAVPAATGTVKRESSTTTDSDAVRPQPADFKRSSTVRRGGRWRKLLSCMN